MAKITKAAGDILTKYAKSKPEQLKCRLCEGSISHDPPETLWIGFDDGGVHFDEHDQCDRIDRKLRTPGAETKLNMFFDSVGIAPDDRKRAESVLRVALRRGQVGVPFAAMIMGE